MFAMHLSEIGRETGAELIGSDATISNLSIDTRALSTGDAYLAFRGNKLDGHNYIDMAIENGAAALIVENQQQSQLPQLLVEDAHKALAAIARLNRSKSDATVIALTGSQGKTTVKEMLACILNRKATTLATAANLNNTVGVPLTLLRIEPKHQFAVIEMGADKQGEIDFSASAAQADIALITCANAAHIEGFGSLAGIVKGKGEILDSLTADGIAVLNADDENVQHWIKRAGHCRQVLFSASGNTQAHYYAKAVSVKPGGRVDFVLCTPKGETDVHLNVLGEHNVANAAAAAAAAMEAGANLSEISQGLADLHPVKGRLVQLQGRAGSVVIDDTYNASPSSFRAAIDVLAEFTRRRVLIAGDMKELGEEAEESHRMIGGYAREKGIDELWVVGDFAAVVAAAYGEGAVVFTDQDALISHCIAQVQADDVCLVKGSRGAHMENVVSSLAMEGSA